MTQILLVGAIFFALALVLFALGALWMSRDSGSALRLKQLLGIAPTVKPTLGATVQRALQPAAKLLPTSPAEMARTRRMLTQAGLREDRHVRLFFGFRAVLVIAPALVVLVLGQATRLPALLVGLPVLGWMAPRLWLKRRIKARAHRIRLSLPDALDLMVICVEAGLGLDQAMQRVCVELRLAHPDLCGEFDLLGLEMRAGVSRAEALKRLTLRCPVDDLRALAAVLIQTERFGTSIAQALRVHSDCLRTERRQRAEEAAAKLSIKMLPVLAMFVFPAVMIVVIGPAALAIMRNLGPALVP
ncbi:MAG: type II secretion system F family protein [Terriglobales bacterium]